MEMEKLKEIMEDVLGRGMDSVTEKTDFVDDLGADSLDMFEILMKMEEKYDIVMDAAALERIRTVGDAAEAVREAIKG
ncbi:MAG: acyl carrier protein [Clostridiales bacterium]|nr:acyl carrier protein [Clostridiales bacterium]MCD8154004.1 acyl carrier protein [Clostridiales bacterium]